MAFLLPPLIQEPFFSKEEMLRFANIADNAGQVFLGSLVLSPFATRLDAERLAMILSGIALTVGFWAISLLLTRKANKRL